MRGRSVGAGLAAVCCATLVHAQNGPTFQQRWYVRSELPNGATSTLTLTSLRGDVPMVGVWHCSYSAASGVGGIAHDVSRLLTCDDGVGAVSIVVHCADNAIANDTVTMSLAAAGAPMRMTHIGLLCRTDQISPNRLE